MLDRKTRSINGFRRFKYRSWRRGRDSNPRYAFWAYTHFPGVRLQPLGHLSGTLSAGRLSRGGQRSLRTGALSNGGERPRIAPACSAHRPSVAGGRKLLLHIRHTGHPWPANRTCRAQADKVAMVRVGSPATTSCKPRQARKGAAVAARLGAGVGLARTSIFRKP